MIGLAKIYKELDFLSGDLLSASKTPPPRISRADWVEKGEWLVAAQNARADRVFFVDNNPVVVFAECGDDQAKIIKAFNRVWSLARPRILFLASPGEVKVYDLAQRPPLMKPIIKLGKTFVNSKFLIMQPLLPRNFKRFIEIISNREEFSRINNLAI